MTSPGSLSTFMAEVGFEPMALTQSRGSAMVPLRVQASEPESLGLNP